MAISARRARGAGMAKALVFMLATAMWLAQAPGVALAQAKSPNASAAAPSANLGADPSECDDDARIEQIEAQTGTTARVFPQVASGSLEGELGRALETSGVVKTTGACAAQPDDIILFIDDAAVAVAGEAADKLVAGGASQNSSIVGVIAQNNTPRYSGSVQESGQAGDGGGYAPPTTPYHSGVMVGGSPAPPVQSSRQGGVPAGRTPSQFTTTVSKRGGTPSARSQAAAGSPLSGGIASGGAFRPQGFNPTTNNPPLFGFIKFGNDTLEIDVPAGWANKQTLSGTPGLMMGAKSNPFTYAAGAVQQGGTTVHPTYFMDLTSVKTASAELAHFQPRVQLYGSRATALAHLGH